MTLQEAIEFLEYDVSICGDIQEDDLIGLDQEAREAIAIILNAVVKGDISTSHLLPEGNLI